MIIYCDGSEAIIGGKCNRYLAYGAVIHSDGTTHELCGRYEVKPHLKGMHEIIAFIESMLFAESHNADLSQVSVYTDDHFLSSAGFHVYRDNYSFNHSMFEKIKLLTHMYGKHIYEKFIYWVNTVRVNWVKGHQVCVDNNRADYLANKSLRAKEISSREEWISAGFVIGKPNGKNIHYPHFALN